MNSLLEFTVVGAIVAAAVAFILIRAWRALRGGRPSCCGDPADAGAKGPSSCEGCAGCGEMQGDARK